MATRVPAYITQDFIIMDEPEVVDLNEARSFVRDGLGFIDDRTGLFLFKEKDQTNINYSLNLYYNYIEAYRFVLATTKPDYIMDTLRLGFIPLILEPTFSRPVYRKFLTEYLVDPSKRPAALRNKKIEYSIRIAWPVRTGKVKPEGSDYWVHRTDWADILGVPPNLVTTEKVIGALTGITGADLDADVRYL